MRSAVVIGGGLAGLTCAWRLARAGCEVEVLERANEAGGRMCGPTLAGFALDAACPPVFEGDVNTSNLVRSLGLETSLQTLPGSETAIVRDFNLHVDGRRGAAGFLRTRLLTRRAKARLLWVGAELVRRRNLDPSRPASAEALDERRFADSAPLRSAAGAELLDALLEPLLCELQIGAAGECSRGFALAQLRGRLRRGRRMRFAGGAGVLVRALAERVSVRVGCAAVAVETETDGVRIRYRAGARTGSVLADAAVVAVPGSEVAAICPKLTPEERGFFARVSYARSITVHLLFDELPSLPASYRVAFPGSARLGLRSVGVDHTRPGAAPPGAGLLAVELSADRADVLWEAADREVAGFALAQLERTPIGRLRPAASRTERRPQAAPLFLPGAPRRLAHFEHRLERSPRLAFAGDYLVGTGAEAAVTSGARAANEIARDA